MNKNFVVLSQARSGSTWLINALNNIDGVTSYGELFLNDPTMFVDGATKMPRFLLWKQTQRGFRPFSTYRYLRNVFDGKGKTCFKLMYPQMFRFPELTFALVFRKIHVIHLVRKNPLDAVLSNAIAFQRGKYHFMKHEEVPDEKQINIDPAFMIKAIRTNELGTRTARTLLKASRLVHKEFYYEDLAADTNYFKPIWEFVGEEYELNPPAWKSKKIRSKSAATTIKNYDEMLLALKREGLDHYLIDNSNQNG